MPVFRSLAVFLTILFLNGCVSQIHKIEKPEIPLERPGYIIHSPRGDGWLFREFDQAGKHTLMFGYPSKSYTYTLYANVIEIPSNTKFESPENFLYYMKKSAEMEMDPRRYNLIEDKMNLDNRFGKYSVFYYSKVEDHGAAQATDVPYLIMETYSYYFIHPTNDNLLITVIYSQRGKDNELDKNFIESAARFIEGLTIKETK